MYLPRSKEWQKKRLSLEKRARAQTNSAIGQTRGAVKSLESQNLSKQAALDEIKEKMNILKIRLKKRAAESQKLIDRALDLGCTEETDEIANMNIKVYELLDIKPEGSSTFLTGI